MKVLALDVSTKTGWAVFEPPVGTAESVGEEGGDVAGVHLAGMVGNAAGQVDGADNGHSVCFHGFAGAGEFAVTAALGGKVDDHGAGGHAFDHVCCDQHGRFFPGNHGGGNDYIAFRYYAGEKFALPRVESFVLGCAVATGVLSVLSFERQFDEAAAKALHLLFRSGTHVVGGGDGAQAARGGDGLRSGDSSADDEYARR